MTSYRPRRASKRWLDGDCPPGVLCLMDSKNSGERYTAIYTAPICGSTYSDTVLWGRGMSENPFHPQGVGVSFELAAHDVAMYRYREKHHYCKWSSLPAEVRKCIRQDMTETA